VPHELPAPPWRRPADRPARQQLSASAIVAAALWVMENEGLDAVRMRRVAQRLDTGAASLYQHVRNKRELHELMLDAVFSDVRLPEPDPARWQAQLKDVLRTMSGVMRSHPGIARIAMETLIPTTPGLLVSMDAMMGLLRAGGVPDRLIASACDALALYVTAHAYEESLWPAAVRPGASPGSERGTDADAEAVRRLAEIQRYLAGLPADRLPHLTALQSGFQAADGEAHFEFALDMMIAGLGTYASRP
jgi:AcrR family transcriptional regulator